MSESGYLHSITDVRSGKCTVYNYDKNGRLILATEYNSSDMSNDLSTYVKYDDYGNLKNVSHIISYRASSASYDDNFYYSYTYDLQNRLSAERLYLNNNEAATSYTYDSFGRVSNLSFNYIGSFTSSIDYTFTEDSMRTSTEVKAYTSTVQGEATAYSYTYDMRGNITSVSVDGSVQYRYVYDNLSQLIREDNIPKNKTYVYAYDNSGNITSRKTYSLTASGATPSGSYTTDGYTYYGNAWGDRLASYNGASITYDGIGNPLSYYDGKSFTWEGRRLVGATNGSKTMSFKYNDEGIRTSKTVNGVTTNYYLNGTQIIAEETNGNITEYLYNSTGVIGFRYRASSYAADKWDIYFFEKNLQNDIVAVYTSSGVKKISYTYDAWGNVTKTKSILTPTVVVNNPFTYRGYYYDKDLGLYYLNSRYYDSQTGRFISADGYVSTGQGILGNNMFSYCGNNPISRTDPGGQIWGSILEFLKTAVQEIGKAVGVMSPAYAGYAGVAVTDGPLPFGDAVAILGASILTAGAVGYGIYKAAQAIDASIPKVEEKSEIVPNTPGNLVIFPVDPNTFNPIGLVKVPRIGTKNGAIISWMDPNKNIEVFRWDENLHFPNGSHYHIYGTGHYYPGTVVPEPYATTYFPFR